MITIFTPVYNRAYIIENLYVSLLRQTCYAFEWLIVDDGSTDDVISLVERWRKNTQEFQIRIYRQENRGKHSAINYGVKLAEYEAFFIVDSDDYLEDDAVETVLEYWSGIHSDCQFAGISGLSRNKHGKMIGGTPCFREYIDATNLEREKFGLEGDKAEVIKEGNDLTIIAIGKMVKRAVEVSNILEREGMSIEVINARFLKPLDRETILSSINKTKNVITIEDNIIKGGLGSSIEELLLEEKLDIDSFKKFGYPDEFVRHGSVSEIEEKYGLDAEAIADCVKNHEKVFDMC